MSSVEDKDAELFDGDITNLADVLSARLGAHRDGTSLARAYIRAVRRNAITRTLGPGPIARSLSAERIDLLMDVSRELDRLLSEAEISALMRVTTTNAKRWHRELLAQYADEANPLATKWLLADAHLANDRAEAHGVSGRKISFASKEKRDMFVDHAKWMGFDVSVLHGESREPFLVVVADDFPIDEYFPASKRSKRSRN